MIGVENGTSFMVNNDNNPGLHYSGSITASALVSLSPQYSISTGLGVNALFIHNYRNHTLYAYNVPYSNVYYTTVHNITSISQQYIRVPLCFYYHINRITLGLGSDLDFLFHVRMNQEVEGTYTYPYDHFYDNHINRLIRDTYNVRNSNDIRRFRRTNISPRISAGYWIRPNWLATFSVSYALYDNPLSYPKLNSYNLLTASVNVYYKFTTHHE
jgi:hypothetical protein